MFNKAEESLRKAVRIDESYAEAFYGLARTRLKKYDSVGARSFLEKCLKIDPSFEKAEEFLAQAIAVTTENENPVGSVVATLGMGHLLIQKEDYVGAIQQFKD